MAYNFVSADRSQRFLLPPDMADWLPDDHLAWFVIDVVEQINLDRFRRVYRADGHGRPAYDPAVMVALLLYAYCSGVRSSRVIERRCVEDVAFRVLAWAAQYLRMFRVNTIGQAVLYDMRNQLFTHIQKLSLRFYDSRPVGKIMSRVTSDVGAINELINGYVDKLKLEGRHLEGSTTFWVDSISVSDGTATGCGRLVDFSHEVDDVTGESKEPINPRVRVMSATFVKSGDLWRISSSTKGGC